MPVGAKQTNKKNFCVFLQDKILTISEEACLGKKINAEVHF